MTTRRKTRKKRPFITTTYHEPKLYKNIRTGWKGFKRQAWNTLALIGMVAVLVFIITRL